MKTKKLLISVMPEQERPREKCALLGPEKLSDVELLALVLRTGTRNQSALALADEILGGGGLESSIIYPKKTCWRFAESAGQSLLSFWRSPSFPYGFRSLNFVRSCPTVRPTRLPGTTWPNSVHTVRNI